MSAINILLIDIGSPHNLGSIIRNNYVLGGGASRLYIFDPRDKINNNRETMDLSSVGLTGKQDTYTIVVDLEGFLSSYPGRIIATDIVKSSVPITEFEFKRGDLFLFGNENRGYHNKSLNLHPGIKENVDSSVIIPMLGKVYELPDRNSVVLDNHGKYPNLNVAASAHILIYETLKHLGHFDNFTLPSPAYLSF